jgi:outer membrane protein
MRLASIVLLLVLLLPAVLGAQTPATTGGKVGFVDFNRVVVESAEGKKKAAEFTTEMNNLRATLEKLQSEITADQERLRTQQNVLSEAARVELTRKIDANTTKLTRDTEDAEKRAAEQQNILFGPIAQAAQAILNAYAKEAGYAAIFDARPETGLLFLDPVADITTEVIRRVDAEMAKAAPAAAPARPAAPAAAPATPAPATPQQ